MGEQTYVQKLQLEPDGKSPSMQRPSYNSGIFPLKSWGMQFLLKFGHAHIFKKLPAIYEMSRILFACLPKGYKDPPEVKTVHLPPPPGDPNKEVYIVSTFICYRRTKCFSCYICIED